MKLRFNDPEEFINELRHSPPDGEPVLRVTVRQQLDRHTGAFRHVSVVASYLRLLTEAAHAIPLSVTLVVYVGEDWGPEFEGSQQVRRRADELLARLRAEAHGLSLECRPGVYEE
jgi:hypothetical protein